MVPHPQHRILAVFHQDLAKLDVRAVLRDARHVVEEVGFGISAEITVRDLLIREVGREGADIVGALVNDAHQPVGVSGIAATFGVRRALQQ